MLKFNDASPSVIWVNTPIRVPLGAISKMMFLLGSDGSTLLTNIAGVPLKMPSESNVMLYQLTSPVDVNRPLAAGELGRGVAGIDLADHRVEVEEDARLARGRVDAVDHARAVDAQRSAVQSVVAAVRARSHRRRCRRRHRARRRSSRCRPPNDEIGVSSDTDVIGAIVSSDGRRRVLGDRDRSQVRVRRAWPRR